MAKKLVENQLFEGKSWNGFTDKNHLINAYDLDPVAVFDKITQIQEVNLGQDFADMVENYSTEYISPEKDEYHWYLQTPRNQKYRLLDSWKDFAGTQALTNTDKPGVNASEFYMDFEGRVFSITETIVGNKPDLYKLLVTGEPWNVGGNVWRFKVQLASSKGPEDFIPYEEVKPGTQWSPEAGLVTDTLSDTGMDISFQSNAMLRGELSRYRLKHTIPGNMMDVKPMGFFVVDKKGQKHKMWISNVEWEYMQKAKMAKAALLMNGQSNRWGDGTYGNVDKNGYEIKAGAGFKEQWAAANKHEFNLEPSLDFMTEFAMDAVVGKVDQNNRTMVVSAGEFGLSSLSKMVQRKLGSEAYKDLSFLQDSTGRAFKWMGNDIEVNLGQFKGVATINGIKFLFMLDKSKDNPNRNKIRHPYGGFASSYEFDITGFGSKSETENMKIIRKEGDNNRPVYAVEEGIRGFINQRGSFNSPKQVSHSVDGAILHYYEPGVGAKVLDPTKVIRYYPSLTQ